MPELDHLVFASRDLDEGIAHVEWLTGVAASPGGAHPGMGTLNALISFDARTYLEIIGADPEQPDSPGPRPYGLDDGHRPRLAAYAVRPSAGETIEHVASTMAAHGFELTDPVPMSRRRPDGVELEWRIAFPATPAAFADGALPFVIDWGGTPSPAATAPTAGPLTGFEVHHPDPAVRAALAALDLGINGVDGPPALVATLDVRAGPVELR
ncbi:MAG: VOC family protein [Acidimicrobiia bacterium]|nr:VOC family protein [Acidimicrobiia bacterium]